MTRRYSSLGLAALWAIGLWWLAAASATGAPADPGWPRTYATVTGGTVQVFQPQIASWDGQRHLVAYMAVAHSSGPGRESVLGTVKVEADTVVSLEARLVSFADLAISEARFGRLDREHTRRIVADLEGAMPSFERVIGLDRVLASLDRSRIQPRNVEGARADPPRIFVSRSQAVLVAFDGRPVWSPVAGNELKFAVNTNWDVFEHAPSKSFYLRYDTTWLKAPSLEGPWSAAGILPVSFTMLPADDNWKAVKASLPGRRRAPHELPGVFVSTVPAELLLLHGAPSYVPVAPDSRLLWVSNTESDLFRMGKDGALYYLVAGRWFSAPDFGGPWAFATPALPSEFLHIGLNHPRSRVLASVPGTPQAAEAVILAQVPQTARVNKREVMAPPVTYQGEPQFEAIERTAIQRAVNTDKDVVKVGDRYYLCYQGVWFVGGTPAGPWHVATSVPQVIYSIPPSSPVHHVTYVTVVDSSTDWIVVASSAGYTGVTIAWGCAVWGTGYYYPPYVWSGGTYPIYYPYHPTYGYSAWYNPWTSTYQRAAVAYGPYGGVGAAARYNPATGTYARGAMAWGPYGATGAGQAYNPRTGVYAQTQQGAGVYGSWGSTYVQRGDSWAQTNRVTNNVTGTTSRVTRTDDGAVASRRGPAGSGFVAAGDEGIYAGHDGNVYRRADDGWQKYEDGAWGQAQQPEGAGQLERDRTARIEGAERARERGAAAGAGSTGSYRPQAGSVRAAGGRRR